MEISLNLEQVELLAAVAEGRVHSDPRFSRPDFERLSENAHHTRRATARLRPLRKALLVVLVDEADSDGVRPYKLTSLGERVLAEARAQQAAALAEPAGSPADTLAV
ncbi:hypothetical protein OOK41_01265 [Micromonospora sp. NBC_01655]|uniref:hypothetical protein n=1 Tax=Micromonospora sp. NBC_01655 TaxID=2975983 RepID=UPI0022523B51|nr:hypothetical protein [Micromonospora sp. NBC_01655]MCX4468953.1 hypothetical protein [Micromonospora sp. NBC_01655]